MNAAKAPMPSWVASIKKDLTNAVRRLEEVELERKKDLEVIAELQRQYQAILQATAHSQAAAAGVTNDEAATYILHAKLQKLTMKRHAVLTAVLAGVGYQELAKIAGWDVTTVKLQLRAALQILGIANREALMVSHRRLLDPISEKDYKERYGISKRWWLEQDPDLMEVLRSVKPAANQYLPAAKKTTRRAK